MAVSMSSLAVLTACSGSGGDPAEGTGDCAAPGVTKTEVKAGMLWADTGPGAYGLRAFRGGVDARLGVANAEGGVHGRKVVYAWRDDASNPALNLSGARELVQGENVFAIMQGPGGASGGAQYLAEQGVPVVGMASDPVWADHDNMISWFYFTTKSGSSTVWGDFIRSQGGSRAATVNIALNAANQDFSRQLAASLEAAGVEIALNFDVTADITSFDSLARQMKEANIDTLTGALVPEVLAALLPAARAAGVDLKVVLVPLGYDLTQLEQRGQAIAGTVIYTSFQPFELNYPAHQRLIDAMTRYVPQIDPPAQDSAVMGWLSADLLLRGLEAAGTCPTRQSFIDALHAIHDYDGGGLLPEKVDLGKNRGVIANCFTFVRVQDHGSAFVPLQPPVRCGNPVS